MPVLSGFYKGLHPFRMMDTIGIALGFEGDAAPMAVADTILAHIACQVVTGV